MERSKFNVDKDKEKRTYDNIVFDSQLEMKYYRDVLCPAVESGEVTHFELQKNMSCNRSTPTMARRFCQSFMLLTFIWNLQMDTLK